jgi:hydroxylaminobenzene mutase
MEHVMSPADRKARQGHLLLQLGMVLFLFSLFIGLAVPKFTVPRLGLSSHLLGLMQAFFLLISGLLWPRLRLAPAVADGAFWLAVYGCLAPLTANVLAGTWGAGNALLPMAAGLAHGTPVQEGVIAVGLRSGAVALIAAGIAILWGLRGVAKQQDD